MISSEEALERVKKLDYSTKPVQDLRDILMSYEFSDRNIFRITIPVGSRTVRVRPNKTPEEAAISSEDFLFRKKSELSCPPIDVTDYNRANIPYKPLFYATLPSENKQNGDTDIYSYLATSFFETIKLTEEIKQVLTYSIWETTKEITLFNVPTRIGLFTQESQLYRKRLDEYIKILLQNGLANPLEDIFIQHLATEMARPINDREYFFTAHFVDYVLHHFTEFDGVLYLSTKMNGYTENIALLPKCVDSALKLVEVSVDVVTSNQNLDISQTTICNGIIGNNSEDSIDYIPTNDFFHHLLNQEQ